MAITFVWKVLGEKVIPVSETTWKELSCEHMISSKNDWENHAKNLLRNITVIYSDLLTISIVIYEKYRESKKKHFHSNFFQKFKRFWKLADLVNDNYF